MPLSTGTANNAGAILVLGRDLVVVPKLIHPLPPAVSSPENSPERHIEDTWMQVMPLFVCVCVYVCIESWVQIAVGLTFGNVTLFNNFFIGCLF